MANAKTQAGAKFYIAVDISDAPAAQNDILADTDYAALTWLEVKAVGSMGETGTTTNLPTYDELATDVTQKGKGISNAGDPEVEVRRIGNDPGQEAMRAAALTSDNYAFKYELNDMPSGGTNGTIRYNRGVVTGPRSPNGRNEDFDLEIYALGLNQREIIVEAV